ncbi:MAG: hypothetical protein WAM28_07265 [Chlamydiales bacterium]
MTKRASGAQKNDSVAFWWTSVWTVIYGIAFLPLLLVFGIWTFVVFENGFSWPKAIMLLIDLCIPFSLPTSIYLMRRYHNCGKYDMTYLAGCIPWVVVGALFFINSLLSGLQNLWKDLFVYPWYASGTPTSCIPHLISTFN